MLESPLIRPVILGPTICTLEPARFCGPLGAVLKTPEVRLEIPSEVLGLVTGSTVPVPDSTLLFPVMDPATLQGSSRCCTQGWGAGRRGGCDEGWEEKW